MTEKPFSALYLDCDTGIDDALAIAYLLGTPAVDIAGIGTVSGNTSAEQAARNTLNLLEIAGRVDIPVAVGAHDWLARPFVQGATNVHGSDGVGDIEMATSTAEPVRETAAEMLIRLSHEHDGRLRVLTTGPLTNIATALAADPGLPARIESVIVMGGAALAPGNFTPVAEANIMNDPEAAALAFAADWDLTLVPLDVTMDNVLDESGRARLASSGLPVAECVARMLDCYFDFYTPIFGRRCSALHDPLAAAIAVGGVLATRAPAVPVTVDTTDGPGRGQTICDLRRQRSGPVDHVGVRTRVVLETSAPLADHLIDRITAGAG